MNLAISVLLVTAALFQLSLSLMILLGGRRPRPKFQKIFVWITSTVVLFSMSSVILLYAATTITDKNIVLFNFVNAVAFADGVLVLFLIYLFNLFYPSERRINIGSRIMLACGVCLAVLSPMQTISGRFQILDKLVYKPGSFSILIAIFGFAVGTTLFISNLHMLRSSTNLKLKRQTTSLLLGLTTTVLHAVVFVVVLPLLLGDNTTLYAIGYFAPFYFTGFVGYSLLKQNLFNIRLVVARTVAYILSLGLITLIFSLLIFGLSGIALQGDSSKILQKITYVVITLVLVVSYPALKRFFDRITNELFYRDAYNPQQILDELNSILVSTIDIEELLKKASLVISKGIKAEYCLFEINSSKSDTTRLSGMKRLDLSPQDLRVIRNFANHHNKKVISLSQLDEKQSTILEVLQDRHIAVVARLQTHSGEIGYLIVGDRKSGNAYSLIDHNFIEIIADELAIAIQNSLRFEEIQQFNITLEQKIDAATKELRRTNAKLKALDEAKDEFISMASHQLRTPLTAVKGYLSMILDGDTGPVKKNQKELTQNAFDGAQRMVYLIADLLNVSRMQTGKFVIENQPSHLPEVVEGEIAQLKEQIANREITVTYDKPERFPTLNLDETKIRQVIMNFLDNALYYTPKGGKVDVALQATDDSVTYTVTDNGVGVPKAVQHHLFSKFYRADNARKMRPDGTGLGLYMAKKVIVAQGGAIIFKSEEGKGSTFGFSFPRKGLEIKSDKSISVKVENKDK